MVSSEDADVKPRRNGKDNWTTAYRGAVVLLIALLGWQGQRIVSAQDSIGDTLTKHDTVLQQLLDAVGQINGTMVTGKAARDKEDDGMRSQIDSLIVVTTGQGHDIADLKEETDRRLGWLELAYHNMQDTLARIQYNVVPKRQIQ